MCFTIFRQKLVKHMKLNVAKKLLLFFSLIYICKGVLNTAFLTGVLEEVLLTLKLGIREGSRKGGLRITCLAFFPTRIPWLGVFSQ